MTKTWTTTFQRTKKTFVLVHFRPFINYSGPIITFNTMITVNGSSCSLKSTQISAISGSTLDTVCAFVAEANTIYNIALALNSNPSSVSHWVDVGQPLLTYIEI